MLSWKEVVQNYIVKHSDKVQKTTKPLRDHFGIGYFTYHRIDANGNYSVLVDRPDFAEYYVEEQLYKEDAFQGLPDMFQPGLCAVQNHMSMRPIKSLLQLDTGVMLIQKSQTDVTFYGFIANEKRSALTAIALNYPELLTSFAAHFTKELECELNEISRNKTSLFHLHGKDTLVKKPICSKINNSAIFSFCDDLGMRREVMMAQKLSKRERECLLLLLNGKSAKETAAILGITRRTVESYFECIKNKLLCWNKQELFGVAKKLQSLHLLSL